MSSDRVKDQPPPVPNEGPAIVDLVMEDLQERKRIGIQRYGTPLQAHNGRNALVDAYQEALDLVIYLRQHLVERNALHEAACPDPALHEGVTSAGLERLSDAVARLDAALADARTELLEAHADLEASRAREQIAAERVAGVLKLCDVTEDRTLHADAWTIAKQIRAILAGDQGEEACADG